MSHQADKYSAGVKHSRREVEATLPEQNMNNFKARSSEHGLSRLAAANTTHQQRKEAGTQPTAMTLNVKELRAELDRARRKLAEIVPSTPFSDQIIKAQYAELCEMIEDWVDANCEDAVSLHREHSDGINVSTTHERLIESLLDSGAALDVESVSPDADSYLPMRIIMRFLFETLLRQKRWHPGMSYEQETLLNITLHNLYDVNPTRSAVWRQSWRCHTYQSLRLSQEIQTLGRNYLEELVEDLVDIMAIFVRPNRMANENALEEIILVAANLADKMRSCPFQYAFVYAFAPLMSVASRKLNKKTIERNAVIDIGTGVSARKSTLCDGIEQEKVRGEVLGTVFPSLFKINADSTSTNIAQGMILVKLVPIIAQERQLYGQSSQISEKAMEDGSAENTATPARQWSSLLR